MSKTTSPQPFRFKARKYKTKDSLGDSSITNGNRAKSGQAVLAYYTAVTNLGGNDDPFTNVSDLFTNLAHLCDREGLNFDDCVENARKHWQAER